MRQNTSGPVRLWGFLIQPKRERLKEEVILHPDSLQTQDEP